MMNSSSPKGGVVPAISSEMSTISENQTRTCSTGSPTMSVPITAISG